MRAFSFLRPALPASLSAFLAVAAFGPAGVAAGREDPEAERSPSDAKSLGFPSLEGQVVYFLMVDRFADGDPARNRPSTGDPRGDFRGGDLAGLEAKIPYLADLGVTAIWLTPIARQVDTVVSGVGFPDSAYHGYWPRDLTGVDPRFGDEAAFDRVIAAAHRHGIRVILDVVINHVGYGSPLEEREALLRSGRTGTCPSSEEATERTQCLFGLPDFKTEDPEVRKLIVERTARWVLDHPVDGFRLDAIKHVDPALIDELRAAVERAHARRDPAGPFLFLGEHWGVRGDGSSVDEEGALPWIGKGGEGPVDTLVEFGFDGLVEGFLNGRLRAAALGHHLGRRHVAPGPPLAPFLDSHDVTSLLARLPEAARHRYPLAPVLQMTVRGMPVITWGDEIGRVGGAWPDNREPFDWAALENGRGRRTHDLYRSLIRLRRRAPALQGRGFELLVADDEPDTGAATLVYRRSSDEGAYLVALRRGPGAARPTIRLDAEVRLVPCLATDGPALAKSWAEEGARRWELSVPADGAVIYREAPAAAGLSGQAEDGILCPGSR